MYHIDLYNGVVVGYGYDIFGRVNSIYLQLEDGKEIHLIIEPIVLNRR